MRIVLLSILFGLIFSFPAQAYFEVQGSGVVQLKDGTSRLVEFGFTFTRIDGRNTFIAGPHKLAVQQVPQKYSLSLVLHNSDYVWVADFANAPLIGFDFKIAGHHIKLYKEEGLRMPGSFVIEIDGIRHHFSRNIGQIDFTFDQSGIKGLEPKSFLRPRQ
ncbi:hypothetical protein [Alkalimonas sp.]|uniref:hypothetical protein n=1 Tax=Alkalimonas sp. TaxID=1872453 RepID=UPI00263A89E2|nr:hypothetical protein [Alkalimonas sp.]MCC5826635.1 hypothetical protein [Alkalimonas sp.]